MVVAAPLNRDESRHCSRVELKSTWVRMTFFYAMYLPHLKITISEKICKKLTAFLQDQKFPGSYRIYDF